MSKLSSESHNFLSFMKPGMVSEYYMMVSGDLKKAKTISTKLFLVFMNVGYPCC